MKHPLWIVNSALFILIILAFGFVYIAQVSTPEREGITPELRVPMVKKESLVINTRQIYENDLFDTFHRELPKQKPSVFAAPFPEPPTPQVATIPEPPPPQFIDPLDVTLKGIIIVGSNETKNRAVIADNKTNTESTYKAGDAVDDAQLIRIFNNKAMFLRANGQQEVLYLREQDALLDPAYLVLSEWQNVIQARAQYDYLINPQAFIKRIANIAQFIDMLGLTTSYRHGKRIGCRIGSMNEKSLGTHLGLVPGDIVTKINNVPTTTTQERFKAYQSTIAKKQDESITVELLRNNAPITISYTLQEFTTTQDKDVGKDGTRQPISIGTSENERKKILEEKYKFAPTLKEIREQEKRRMLEKGRASHE